MVNPENVQKIIKWYKPEFNSENERDAKFGQCSYLGYQGVFCAQIFKDRWRGGVLLLA